MHPDVSTGGCHSEASAFMRASVRFHQTQTQCASVSHTDGHGKYSR